MIFLIIKTNNWFYISVVMFKISEIKNLYTVSQMFRLIVYCVYYTQYTVYRYTVYRSSNVKRNFVSREKLKNYVESYTYSYIIYHLNKNFSCKTKDPLYYKISFYCIETSIILKLHIITFHVLFYNVGLTHALSFVFHRYNRFPNL